MAQRIVVTGGAGFIGSHFVRHVFENYADYRPLVVDALTYAGSRENLAAIPSNGYDFIKADITNLPFMSAILRKDDLVVHFAAESHVDRSIAEPLIFTQTNVFGTHALLEAGKRAKIARFLYVSTDEVYGSLDPTSPSSRETDLLRPRSPYSASKAGGEHLVSAYHATFGMDTVITRGSNTYGPRQYPEKIIPLFCRQLVAGKKVPVYGTGQNVRDWMHVQDHCAGIDHILHQGASGEIYNLGGGTEITNLELTRRLLQAFGKGEEAISFVEDRKGHDLRYSLNTEKAQALGWSPRVSFEQGLHETVEWYKQRGEC
ncbi:dTDP-glucose 4,6-dehydratase [Candidatus Pacearchaeota archaeon]|nr:dTDP-glucose 4,6-dehydratase [Candidatus Pacearchaeota archaeon]